MLRMRNDKRTSMIKNTPKVLVVGAGPVGMFAALALTKRGVSPVPIRGHRTVGLFT